MADQSHHASCTQVIPQKGRDSQTEPSHLLTVGDPANVGMDYLKSHHAFCLWLIAEKPEWRVRNTRLSVGEAIPQTVGIAYQRATKASVGGR